MGVGGADRDGPGGRPSTGAWGEGVSLSDGDGSEFGWGARLLVGGRGDGRADDDVGDQGDDADVEVVH